jgi:5'(3')-deoxyribonucleotidase
MKKPTIAVDIDDVLAANAEGFVKFSNERWGTHLTVDDFTENWAEMWQVEHDEWIARRHQVIDSRVHLTYRSFDEALPVLKRLAKKYKLVIVSSRSKQISKDTTEWIERYFGDVFSEIHYAKIWDDMDQPIDEKIKLTKKDVLQQVGADYLIDDQIKHCVAAAEAGIKALLFGDYAWNKLTNLPDGVTRVKDWAGVEEYFRAKG